MSTPFRVFFPIFLRLLNNTRDGARAEKRVAAGLRLAVVWAETRFLYSRVPKSTVYIVVFPVPLKSPV